MGDLSKLREIFMEKSIGLEITPFVWNGLILLVFTFNPLWAEFFS